MIDYLRTLLLFYRRHLRVQPLRELMAITGVAAGVALLFAVQVAHHSITGSFEEITHGVAGRATLEVASRGPQGFNEAVAEEVERMPDVKASAPILQQPIVAVGPGGRRALTLVGATEQVGALDGRLSLQFQRAGESSRRGLVLLTEPTARAIGVHPGEVVTILVAGRTERLSLDATIPSAKIGPVAESPIAAAPLPIVQGLAGLHGLITRVLIEPRAGRGAALRQALSNRFGATLNVRSVDAEAQLLGNAAGPETQITLLFSAISLVAGIILAYNALLLASEERRRFVVYLIESGTPDAMIISSLAFDALILGILGSLLGLLAGEAISLFAYRAVPGYIAAAFAIGGQRVVSPQTVLIALGGGLAAAFAAAALPALSILRGGVAAEPDAVGSVLSVAGRLRVADRFMFGVGVLLVSAAILAALLAPGTAVVALVGLIVGLVTCLPMTARFIIGLARAASRHSRDPSARLAVAELRSSPARSVALLATGTIAVFLMVLIGGSVADVQHAARVGAADLLSSGELWVKPGGAENVYTTQPFSYAETQRRLEAVSVVHSVLPWRDIFLDLPHRRIWVIGVPPQVQDQIAPSQIVEGSLALADQRVREGGWVAMSQPIAREEHARLGGLVTLPTPSGMASFRLAATIANYGWLPGAIVMNANDQARLWRSSAASQLSVTLQPGVLLARGKHAVEQALPDGAALAVRTDAERRSEVSAVLGSTLSRLSDTTIAVLIATVASVIAMMVAAIWQRRGRLDSLMSIGMSFAQLARLVFYESGLVLLSGCFIGMAGGIIGQFLIDRWLHQTTGASVQFMPAWQIGLRSVAIAAGISVVAAVVVVVRTVGFQPRAAFSAE